MPTCSMWSKTPLHPAAWHSWSRLCSSVFRRTISACCTFDDASFILAVLAAAVVVAANAIVSVAADSIDFLTDVSVFTSLSARRRDGRHVSFALPVSVVESLPPPGEGLGHADTTLNAPERSPVTGGSALVDRDPVTADL
eukprot:COSAG05_NODE_434_length_9856_cov_1158.820027_3_plen_140_part_00